MSPKAARPYSYSGITRNKPLSSLIEISPRIETLQPGDLFSAIRFPALTPSYFILLSHIEGAAYEVLDLKEEKSSKFFLRNGSLPSGTR